LTSEMGLMMAITRFMKHLNAKNRGRS